MIRKDPILSTDAQGVWREDTPGHRYGIEWGEIYRVVGGKLDGITEMNTYVELEFDYGHFLEFYDCWPGFVELLTRLPGTSPEYRRIGSEGSSRLEARTSQLSCGNGNREKRKKISQQILLYQRLRHLTVPRGQQK
jgi:hypothetical protein